MVKLILSDLDGTLVPEGSSVLPDFVQNAFAKAEQVGIPFAISSGRQAESVRRVLSSVSDHPLVVALNGGVIYQGNECLYTDPLPQDIAMEIARTVPRNFCCDVILETKDECWVYGTSCGIPQQLLDRNYHFTVVEDLSEVTGEVIKVACFVPDGIAECVDWASRKWGEQVNVARSGAMWVDFNVADKGKGLLAACRLLGVRPEETIAFGDNFNDLSMLEAAGEAWVAEGANPELCKRFPVCHHPVDVLEKIFAEN